MTPKFLLSVADVDLWHLDRVSIRSSVLRN
jgi:hypothetical protein